MSGDVLCRHIGRDLPQGVSASSTRRIAADQALEGMSSFFNAQALVESNRPNGELQP